MTLVKYWLILCLYMLLIFVLSSLSKVPLPESSELPLDKFYHTIEYGLLAYLMLRAFRSSSWKFLNSHAYFYAFVISATYGASDEFHQIFVKGREASILDWIFDVIGASLVVAAALYLKRLKLQEK